MQYYTRSQVDLMNLLRELWEQHVYWTRFFIISTAENLGDLEAVTKRLLQNPSDFAEAFSPFYTTKTTEAFKFLFTQHLLIAADLVTAAKNKDLAKVEEARKKWYMNANDIAKFLSEINPYWNMEKWKTLLYRHLEMTEKEAVLRLSKKYEEDIQIFDMIEKEALEMADFMSCGIIRQFSYR
ncbi:acetylglutamate kinase [Lachnospiraceae bacterium LCP25S3_G4]